MTAVDLVWITPDAEKLVGKIARVSNPANEDNPNVERLIRYLIKHKHWSPFEMVSMCCEIKTTRAIAAQILRHRSFSFQEFSQRYAEPVAEFPFTVPQLRLQDKTNRQNSLDELDDHVAARFRKRILDQFTENKQLYQDMIDEGIAKECARAVLPLNTDTRLYMSGTLRSWLHYVDLRSANGTQAEHREIALLIQDILKQQVPVLYSAMFLDDSQTKTGTTPVSA